ncbi:stomatin-3 [Elysia marginata]|uniref:Stomatin-3 n=1 Tax=Elysia marginata TaxID=1093978 RepID=A0AAV4G2Y1_9GAST|nr:stomatin-3 [Elysia marginata]
MISILGSSRYDFTVPPLFQIALDYERFVLFRLGRMTGGPRGPGPTFLNPLIDNLVKVDMRTITFDVPPQEVLTKDSVTVSVDAVVYFRVFEPIPSVLNVVNANHATRLLAQTSLRNLLGTLSLSEILSQRDHISSQMQTQLDEATDVWGIKVERVEIKDVILPKELQRAMAAEAEAAREAKAKVLHCNYNGLRLGYVVVVVVVVVMVVAMVVVVVVIVVVVVVVEVVAVEVVVVIVVVVVVDKAKVIAAEGEFRASQSLQAAAEVISKSPSALHLRYLQTLNTISAEKNSTVIFPFPIEMLRK